MIYKIQTNNKKNFYLSGCPYKWSGSNTYRTAKILLALIRYGIVPSAIAISRLDVHTVEDADGNIFYTIFYLTHKWNRIATLKRLTKK